MIDESLMNSLLNILEQEYKVYEDVLRLSKQKTDIIVEGRVAELDNIVKLEQSLVIQISRIENQREQLLSDMLPDKKDITITELKNLINNKQKSSLDAYQTKLTKMLNELKHVNQLNSKLIKNSLEYIEFSLNLMSNVDATSNNYGNGGTDTQRARRNFFDMKL